MKTLLCEHLKRNDLDEEDKQTIFKMIETFLTKMKFKDFFNKNVAAL